MMLIMFIKFVTLITGWRILLSEWPCWAARGRSSPTLCPADRVIVLGCSKAAIRTSRLQIAAVLVLKNIRTASSPVNMCLCLWFRFRLIIQPLFSDLDSWLSSCNEQPSLLNNSISNYWFNLSLAEAPSNHHCVLKIVWRPAQQQRSAASFFNHKLEVIHHI